MTTLTRPEPHSEITVRLRRPHPKQELFIDSPAKRKIIRAGRRGGKTVGIAILALRKFLEGRRVLYAAPTSEQVGRFWFECNRALEGAVRAGAYRKNETEHIIERAGSENRIRAKTAWNANTLRGDYADVLILDEWQLMDEEAWELVGAPMLLDNDGDAIFIYTPPSLHSRSVSKARDPRHAAKMFKAAEADTTGRWATFHFRSADNPTISQDALAEIGKDMTNLAYRQEILAEDIDEAPGALWKRNYFQYAAKLPDMVRIVVGIDPSGGSDEAADEQGIIVGGKGKDGLGYVLADGSCRLSPDGWAKEAIRLYHRHKADRIVAEKNFGGDMVSFTIHTADANAPVKLVSASRGKAVRAEPIAAMYEQGKILHGQSFPALEDELCAWTPEDKWSPNRLDALVWVMSELFPPSGFKVG